MNIYYLCFYKMFLSILILFQYCGINYKYGLFDLIKTDDIKSGKFRDLQISLFIPF
jgi:hypothetical protein